MAEDYQYISDIAVQNLDTGDTILYGNKRDPRWLRIVEWMAEGNEIKPPDGTQMPYQEIRDKARIALHLIDWTAKVQAAESGQARLDALDARLTAGTAKIIDLNAAIASATAATTLVQLRQPLIDALTATSAMFAGVLKSMEDERVLLQGLKDEAVDNLRRTRALLQALAWTDDDTDAT